MPGSLSAEPAWRHELVAIKIPAGQLFLLLALTRSPCDICRYGTRFDTTWASIGRQANRITWCTSCFNAECEPVSFDEALAPSWSDLMERAATSPSIPCWSGARAAVEDLERRGLL